MNLPITPTDGARPIDQRIDQIERAQDGSIVEMRFRDDRGLPARIRFESGAVVVGGRACICWCYDSDAAECGFVYTERPSTPEERALVDACARSPRGVEMLFTAARAFVEASIMAEVRERFDEQVQGVLERVLPPGGRSGGGWVTESADDLDRWLGDRLRPFERSAAFGPAAARLARSIWCCLMTEAIHEEQAARTAAAEAADRAEPNPRTLH
jgi:hypothetical protein